METDPQGYFISLFQGFELDRMQIIHSSADIRTLTLLFEIFAALVQEGRTFWAFEAQVREEEEEVRGDPAQDGLTK